LEKKALLEIEILKRDILSNMDATCDLASMLGQTSTVNAPRYDDDDANYANLELINTLDPNSSHS
jgi:hypothetical protein